MIKRDLTYHERYSLDRAYLPGLGHFVHEEPTREDYQRFEDWCWIGGRARHLSWRLIALRRTLGWTPKHLKEDRQ